MADNISPHKGSNQGSILFVGHPFQYFYQGWLSGEGQSSKRIHNQIDPEHLDCCQGRVSQN